jgi:hypothetical protein
MVHLTMKDTHPGVDRPTLRLSPPAAELARLRESATTPPIPPRRGRDRLLPGVGVGNRVVSWIGNQGWTLLAMSGEEFTWRRDTRDTSDVNDASVADPGTLVRGGRRNTRGDPCADGVTA